MLHPRDIVANRKIDFLLVLWILVHLYIRELLKVVYTNYSVVFDSGLFQEENFQISFWTSLAEVENTPQLTQSLFAMP